MEVAAFLVTTAASVTVIGKDPVPFFASLGEQVGQARPGTFDLILSAQVGRFLLGMHRENKVQFCLGEQVISMSREFKIFKLLIQVAEFIGSEGRLTGVRLRFEEFLPCHFLLWWNFRDILTNLFKL